jgi:hypothetical protein
MRFIKWQSLDGFGALAGGTRGADRYRAVIDMNPNKFGH